jgi:DDE superfamily endonuclease
VIQPRTGCDTTIQGARDRLIRLLGRHPTWALGFGDETWWSRFARPAMHAWAEEDQPMRLIEQARPADDPDPKALACYGLLVRRATDDPDQVWLRFVDGQPVSALTTTFLGWCCQKLERIGAPVLLLVWDNASWHISREVRAWLRDHNRRVKLDGQGVRILVCQLPIKSPWLNPIEPKWIHPKRKVVEPAGLLAARELEQRVCDALGCPVEDHLCLSFRGDRQVGGRELKSPRSAKANRP